MTPSHPRFRWDPGEESLVLRPPVTSVRQDGPRLRLTDTHPQLSDAASSPGHRRFVSPRQQVASGAGQPPDEPPTDACRLG